MRDRGRTRLRSLHKAQMQSRENHAAEATKRPFFNSLLVAVRAANLAVLNTQELDFERTCFPWNGCCIAECARVVMCTNKGRRHHEDCFA